MRDDVEGTESGGRGHGICIVVVVVVFAARLVVVEVFAGNHGRPRRVPSYAPLLSPLLGAGLPAEDTVNVG